MMSMTFFQVIWQNNTHINTNVNRKCGNSIRNWWMQLNNGEQLASTALLFFYFYFFYFLTLQYCIGFAIYQHESATGIHMFPNLNPPSSSLPVPSLWVVPVHQPPTALFLTLVLKIPPRDTIKKVNSQVINWECICPHINDKQ